MTENRSESSQFSGMPECAQVRDDLGAFIDGELGPDVRSRVSEHLGICDECRRFERALREDWQVFGALPNTAESDPEAFLAGVHRLIRRDGRRRFFRVGAAVAAAAILGFVLWPRDLDLPEDAPIIENLGAVEDLHGEIDPEILNLLAMNPDLFLPPVNEEESGGFASEEFVDNGGDESGDASIDDIIDFLLDESEGRKL